MVFEILSLIRNFWLQVTESTQVAGEAERKESVSLGDKATRKSLRTGRGGDMLYLSVVVH